MEKGHVFRLAPCWFCIFTTSAPWVFVRIINVETCEEACEYLSAQFAGHFIPTTPKTEYWARRAYDKLGQAILLTN